MFYKTNMAESNNILARLHDVPGETTRVTTKTAERRKTSLWATHNVILRRSLLKPFQTVPNGSIFPA
jgi:hypothetical protein